MTFETSVSALLCFKGGLKWRYRGSRFEQWSSDKSRRPFWLDARFDSRKLGQRRSGKGVLVFNPFSKQLKEFREIVINTTV